VRFSPPYTFNDPFEGRPTLGSNDEWFALHRSESLRRRRDRPQTLAQLKIDTNEGASWRMALAGALRDRVGLLCLSEDPLNLLMWGHYGDSHRGGVVEFDARHPFFQQRTHGNGLPNFLRKVRYRKTRPLVPLEFFERYPREKIHLEGWATLLRPLHPIFYTKSSHWSYEKEWRLIRQLDNDMLDLGAAMGVRHERILIHPTQLIEVPLKAVRSITLGATARRFRYFDADGLEEEVRAILAKRPFTSHIRLRKVRIHDDEYRLTWFSLDNAAQLKKNTSTMEQKLRRSGAAGTAYDPKDYRR